MQILNSAKQLKLQKKQKGAALFVSLVFLLILSVLGVSSMNDTIMQGKMASAIQDGNVALQGAETAVRIAEEAIEGFISTNDFTAAGPLYTSGNAPDPFAAATWTGNTASRETGAVTGQVNQPRYFIELAGMVSDLGSSGGIAEIGNAYGTNTGESDITTFRIVARGTGGTGTSQRVIEAFYGRRL